jgi:Beta-propeller repeat
MKSPAGPLPLSTLRRLRSWTAVLALGLGTGGVTGDNVPASAGHIICSHVSQRYGRLPMGFEQNQGQIASKVQFVSRGGGAILFLTSNGAVLALNRRLSKDEQHGANLRTTTQQSATTSVVRLTFAGATPGAQAGGLEPLPGKSNYFIGNDPAQWRTNVPSYAKVRYSDLYPGVDLVYYANHGQLEYDLVVAPGASPRSIRLSLQGADRFEIGANGDLVLHTAGGEVLQRRPVAYQETRNGRRRVEARYVPIGEREVRIAVGSYNEGEPLILDPVLDWSTYLGGNGNDEGHGITIDGDGNVYVTGRMNSITFPVINSVPGSIQPANAGGDDAFVTKINAAGTAILYSTFLGGSGDDWGNGIAVDSAGNAYVTGQTTSTAFPRVSGGSIQSSSGGGQDAFVTKINPSGTAILYSTFLGGTDDDGGFGIAVDDAGDAYVTGYTSSATFPGISGSSIQSVNRGGFGDAFVTKINPVGTAILYSTFLGGAHFDAGQGIAVDGAGNAYVTGVTRSTTFPGVGGGSIQSTAGGGQDAFVTKINAVGTALLYSTFLGGSGDDHGFGIAVDGVGNAYVTGQTGSSRFPGTSSSAIQPQYGGDPADAFVAKINSAGNAIVYATYLGGSSEDVGYAIAVDAAGNAYVVGTTNSSDFPVTSGIAIQPVFGGSNANAFVTKIATTGNAMAFSTYLGGSGGVVGLGIAVDGAGSAYVTGLTTFPNFPGASSSAIQPVFGGGDRDAFVVKLRADGRRRRAVRQ